jgi:hypothetical protein
MLYSPPFALCATPESVRTSLELLRGDAAKLTCEAMLTFDTLLNLQLVGVPHRLTINCGPIIAL